MAPKQRMRIANEKATKFITQRGNVPKSTVSFFLHVQYSGTCMRQRCIPAVSLKPLLHFRRFGVSESTGGNIAQGLCKGGVDKSLPRWGSSRGSREAAIEVRCDGSIWKDVFVRILIDTRALAIVDPPCGCALSILFFCVGRRLISFVTIAENPGGVVASGSLAPGAVYLRCVWFR